MKSKTIFIILITVFYIFGISAQITSSDIVFALFCLVALLCGLFLNKINSKTAIILFVAFCLGFLNMNLVTKSGDSLKDVYLNAMELQGRVESIPQISLGGNRAKFYLNVSSANKKELSNTKTLIVINDNKKSFEKIKIGDTIKIKGNLRTPMSATNPSQFDYAKYLKYKDTFSILYSEGNNFTVIKTADTLWWKILANLDAARDKILEKHACHIKSPRLEVLGGIVFGNEAINPPDEVKQSFVNSGLLHLLAASGLNVALIFGIWWFIAQKLALPYILSITGGMVFVILYTFMTGFPPSILRAAIMILFVLFGKLIDRDTKPIALIFFVGLTMLIFDPKMFTDVGFQLSFIVTIGLIICVSPIVEKFKNSDKKFRKKIKNYPKIAKIFLNLLAPRTVAAAIAVPLVAQIFVAPLQMYYFNTFTPYSLIANLCVLPFIGIISFLGFISSILSNLPFLGNLVIVVFDFIVNPLLFLLVEISKYFSSLKYSTLQTPSPSLFQMFLFWGLVILFVENVKSNFINKKIVAIFSVLLLTFALTFINPPSKNLEILTFDVGNADCFLIKTPENKYIMIDTGRLPFRGSSNAKTIVEEYLKDKNIRKIDILIITHFDSDHSGGAIDILKDLKVEKSYVNTILPNNNTGNRILNYLSKGGFNYKVANNNEVILKENETEVRTFVANIKNGSDNDNSIIVYVKNKEISALFMADATVLSFKRIEKYIPNADILKVGHHGAKGVIDREMINKLNPHYAIISSGYNIYGHPDNEIMKILNDSGAKTYVTNKSGAIKFSNCKNRKCKVEVYKKSF